MFVDAVTTRNPELIETAFELHASGEIGPATFVVDVETVERNAHLLAERASGAGIRLYFMAKQLGRNPVIAERISASIPTAVAVEFTEAVSLARAGIRIGHLGHLVQVPARFVDDAVALRPEVITVFGHEKAAQISAAAERAGVEQALLVRVRREGDHFYPGQDGGVELADLAREWERIESLPGVRAAGVTSFPAFALGDGGFAPTPNMETLQEAVETIGGVEQVNAPGHTSAAVLPLLEQAGATHGEPGHALTGTTPLAAREQIDEVPACCMISEVSHLDADRITVFGGAFYNRGHAQTGILGHGRRRQRLPVRDLPSEAIDYYRQLDRDGAAADVGDPVVFAHRFQAFTSRGKVAIVDGIGRGRPELIAMHDGLGNPVPVGPAVPGAAP